MEFNNFLTIDYIKTFMGTVTITMLLVQFIKDLPIIQNFKTKYLTFLVAFANILMCSILTNAFSFANLYLIILNSVLITFTSTGSYDFVKKEKKE